MYVELRQVNNYIMMIEESNYDGTSCMKRGAGLGEININNQQNTKYTRTRKV